MTVQFQGICTHFSREANSRLDVNHRVVLVNASGLNIINDILIPPHIATMSVSSTVDHDGPQTFTLQGVRIRVETPGTGLDLTQDFINLTPNLTQLMNPILTLGVPSTNVFDGSWPAIGAFFDTDQGVLSSFIDEDGAVASQLEMDAVEVIGPPTPTHIRLHIEPLPGATNPVVPPVSSPLRVLVPATITISNRDPNETIETEHTGSHFLLHYILAAVFPPAPQIPKASVVLDETFGSGCSDSNYP
ncbi:MAG TPA: hypothetical protein VHW00_06335 [Thermoanaerobaculia bacterium]|nr:hypothetical protein [Thermoanaerobaculia bacterium]